MTVKRAKRKELYKSGTGNSRVRVVVDRVEDRAIVYFTKPNGEDTKRKFARTPAGQKEAVAFAEGLQAERERMRQGVPDKAGIVTVRQLWAAYSTVEFSDAPGEGLRDATVSNYTQHWQRFEKFVGKDADALSIKAPRMAEFRKELTAADIVGNQIKHTFQVVRTVYRWGVENDIIEASPLVLLKYKTRKDAPDAIDPEQFTEDELLKLLAAINYNDPRQWKAWVCIMIAGYHGQRVKAVRHLRWRDIDFAAGTVTWPKEFQKTGKPLVQPILWETLSALKTAQIWRDVVAKYPVRKSRDNALARPARMLEADWVIFGERDKGAPVGYQSVHYHLLQAEIRAGVTHQDYRAFHGLKKRTVTRVIELTGDRMLGLEFVGNRSSKYLANYDRGVSARVQDAADSLTKQSTETSRNRPDQSSETTP